MGDPFIVLLIDSDDSLASVIGRITAAGEGLHLERASGTKSALRRLEKGDVGIVLAYHSGPKMENDICRIVRAACDRLAPAVVLSDGDDPQSRLQFLNWGAVDCLQQPLDVRRLAFLFDLLRPRSRPGAPSSLARGTLSGPLYSGSGSGSQQSAILGEKAVRSDDDFMAASPAMTTLVGQIRRVAPLDTTLLLVGETGCGKTHAARAVHQYSTRVQKPFVVVECGALTPSLLSSELFGHVRGDFTGADRDYAGKLASAKDGTVFLDEIDTMPLECQAKLLRCVDDRIFQAVGSTQSQPLRARLIAATNRPLEEEVAAGRFRADLYYRLNVISFPIPPLRQRQSEIQPLAERFLATFAQRAERSIRGFTPRAIEGMWCYHWPGNIRELRNTVERCVALCGSPMIDMEDLSEPIQRAYEQTIRRNGEFSSICFPMGNKLAAARTDGERQRLLAALDRHNHNRTNAAAELGISRVTLYKKLRQHRLG